MLFLRRKIRLISKACLESAFILRESLFIPALHYLDTFRFSFHSVDMVNQIDLLYNHIFFVNKCVMYCQLIKVDI